MLCWSLLSECEIRSWWSIHEFKDLLTCHSKRWWLSDYWHNISSWINNFFSQRINNDPKVNANYWQNKCYDCKNHQSSNYTSNHYIGELCLDIDKICCSSHWTLLTNRLGKDCRFFANSQLFGFSNFLLPMLSHFYYKYPSYNC